MLRKLEEGCSRLSSEVSPAILFLARWTLK